MISTKSKNCLTCRSYALWDGDYTCVMEMKILSGCGENYRALNPENVLKEGCSLYLPASSKRREFNVNQWITHNQNISL